MTEANDTVTGRNVFTTVSSFRHTFEVERALQKAMREKRCTKAHVIYLCLTGGFNINRYLDNLDESDLKWCYEQKLRLLREQKAK